MGQRAADVDDEGADRTVLKACGAPARNGETPHRAQRAAQGNRQQNQPVCRSMLVVPRELLYIEFLAALRGISALSSKEIVADRSQ